MKKKTPVVVKFTGYIGFILMISLLAIPAQKKEPAQTRDIVSEDFVKNRPNKANSSTRAKKISYRNKGKTKRLSRRYKSKVGRSRAKPKPRAKAKAVNIKIGITMWKLRPPRPDESGPFLPVKTSENTTSLWTPERVGENTVFRENDLVRIAIEPSIKGYLYIINSEVYSDDTIGTPYLIFPEKLKGNNRVVPGLLVDIPDQNEDFPYFRIATKRRDYVGEALLIVIAPYPLKNLNVNDKTEITSIDVIEELEKYAEAQIFSTEEGIGSVLTSVEKDAACGSRSRQLTPGRNVGGAPCGIRTRQLTREDPLPQTIYETKAYPGQPVAFHILMKVNQSL